MQQHMIASHLLHRFGTGRENARRFQDPLQSQYKLTGTESCCPIWVSPPPQRLLFCPSSAGKKA